MTLIIVFGIIAILIFGSWLFISLSPQFGKSYSKEKKKEFEKLSNYTDGVFKNEIETKMEMGTAKVFSIIKDYWNGIPRQKPEIPLPVNKVDSLEIVQNPDSIYNLIWFGHSAFLLQFEGLNILIDPMFGSSPSPIPAFGSKRFSYGLPIEVSKLPEIDLIIFSHDHYDHLDYPSVKSLHEKTKKFFVPLGVGEHLKSWGVSGDKIKEFNWEDSENIGDISFISTPARHFSGRALNDRFKTLWSSWVIKSDNYNFYFSGDGGYGPHFIQIGEKYGPFDIALLECGQYDERWNEIHMMPEETAMAAKELRASVFMPIHWGSFVLALHSWDDPVKRVTKKAVELNVPVLSPMIGEKIDIKNTNLQNLDWWKGIN